MNSKLINQSPKTLAIVFETGDEVIAGLKQAAREYNLAASHFTAIGAFSELVVGFFNAETKEYQQTSIHQQMEVLSLIGSVSLLKAEPQLHAHIVVGLSDATTRGGHLMRGIVRPTLEVVLVESPVHLRRQFDPGAGLPLIDLGLADLS